MGRKVIRKSGLTEEAKGFFGPGHRRVHVLSQKGFFKGGEQDINLFIFRALAFMDGDCVANLIGGEQHKRDGVF